MQSTPTPCGFAREAPSLEERLLLKTGTENLSVTHICNAPLLPLINLTIRAYPEGTVGRATQAGQPKAEPLQGVT